MPEQDAPQQEKILPQILVFTLVRMVLNTGFRMVYPFLPALARGVGVEFNVMAQAVNARSGLGIIGPLLGSVADLRGRKAALLAGMFLYSAGLTLVILWPTFPVLVAGLMLVGTGKLVYDPAMQAYLGDRVPYQRRGVLMAVTELGWSAAFLLGMPVVGWLIARQGWLAPFPLLAGLGGTAILALWLTLPADNDDRRERQSLAAGFAQMLTHPPALAGLAVGALIGAGNEVVNLVYGEWMENAFGMQIAALGMTAAVIGVSELSGEGLVALLVDRLGKKRAVVLGTFSNAAASLLLPLVSTSPTGAMLGLFLFYITFEFSLVASIPLMSELLPRARATLMGTYMSAINAGRMLAGISAPALFRLGISANSTAAIACDLAAVALLILLVRVDGE